MRKKTKLTFDAHVREEKRGAEPGDLGLERLPRTAARRLVLTRVFDPVDLAGLGPEGGCQPEEFERRGTDLSLFARTRNESARTKNSA